MTSAGTPRVGLVLGGGGATGAAFHVGALAALHHDLGWDPRDAEVILGTSAGSIVGALLRLGVAPSDMVALLLGDDTLATDDEIIRWHEDRQPLTTFGPKQLSGRPRAIRRPALAGLARSIRRRRLSAVGLLAMLLPNGAESMLGELEALDRSAGDCWPDRSLLISATRRTDCGRTIFGHGGPAVELSRAVAASCAVPGYFTPVEIGGEEYVDGGLVSATNAGVLSRPDLDLDLAIVVSPMSGSGGPTRLARAVRRFSGIALRHEVAILERRGIPTVVVEAGPLTLDRAPIDFMDESANVEIMHGAFSDTGITIRSNDLLGRVARPQHSALV